MQPRRRIHNVISGSFLLTVFVAGISGAQSIQAFLDNGKKLARKGRSDEAIEQFSRGIESAAAANDSAALASLYYQRAAAQLNIHHEAEALKDAAQAVDAAKAANRRDLQGPAYLLLADVAIVEGAPQLAIVGGAAAADYFASIHDEKKEAEAFFVMGRGFMRASKYSLAQGFYTKALGLDPFWALQVHLEQARIYYEIGDYLHSADSILKELPGCKRDNNWYCLTTDVLLLARIASVGHEPETAFKLLDRAMFYAEKGSFSQDLGTLARLELLLNAGRVSEAKSFLDRAHGPLMMKARIELEEGLYEAAMQTFAEKSELIDKTGQMSAMLAWRLGYAKAAEEDQRCDLALEGYSGVMDMIEGYRRDLTTTGQRFILEAQPYGFPLREAYEGAVRCNPKTPSGNESAFLAAENSRGRELTDTVGGIIGSQVLSRFPELKKQSEEISRRWSLLDTERGVAAATGNQEKLKSTLDQMTDVMKEWDLLIGEFRSKYPQYAAATYTTALPVSQLKIQPHEVLVEYAVTETSTRVFLLKGPRLVATIEIPVPRKILRQWVLRIQRSLEIETVADQTKYDLDAAFELYKAFLRPVLTARGADGLPLITANTPVIVSPDAELALVSFDALPSTDPGTARWAAGKSGPYPSGVEYVGDHYDLAYTPSANALTLARSLPRSAPTKELLVIADPVLDETDERLAMAKNPATVAQANLPAESSWQTARRPPKLEIEGVDLSSTLPGVHLVAQRLPILSRMADDLIHRVFTPETGQELLGLDVNKTSIRDQKLDTYRYIVFGTHGILDGSIPELHEPALVLSQYKNKRFEEGFLTASDVAKLHLNSDVVALAACQTGVGEIVAGQGVMGLSRAFQMAGARAVVATLWSVEAQSTVDFMERLFTHLREGKTPRQAMRQARRELRAAGYDHPLYWAPFVLFTD